MPTNAPVSESVNGSPADTPTEPNDYAALNAVFAALLAGVVVAARERTRDSEPLTTREPADGLRPGGSSGHIALSSAAASSAGISPTDRATTRCRVRLRRP